jgi:hypothetical protein
VDGDVETPLVIDSPLILEGVETRLHHLSSTRRSRRRSWQAPTNMKCNRGLDVRGCKKCQMDGFGLPSQIKSK